MILFTTRKNKKRSTYSTFDSDFKMEKILFKKTYLTFFLVK